MLPRFIIGEFIGGVFLCLLLGFLSLVRGHARWETGLGVWLLLIALNYVPLLIYSVLLRNRQTAQEEVTEELTDKARTWTKFGGYSLLLMVPFVIPIIAIVQELSGRRTHNT